MAQINAGDWPIDAASTTGNELADLLNRLTAAIMSGNAGTARPPNITAGMVWTRANANGTYNLMLFRGSADTTLLTVAANGAVTPAGTYSTTDIDNKIQASAASVKGGVVNTITQGGGITVSGTATAKTIAHGNTSSVGNNTNANGVVIQTLTFDTYGHVQTQAEVNLDDRYYTKGQMDSRYVNNTGDTINGSLNLTGRLLFSGGSGSSTAPLVDLGDNTGIYRVGDDQRMRATINGTASFDFYEGAALNGNAAVVTRSQGDARWATKDYFGVARGMIIVNGDGSVNRRSGQITGSSRQGRGSYRVNWNASGSIYAIGVPVDDNRIMAVSNLTSSGCTVTTRQGWGDNNGTYDTRFTLVLYHT